MSDTSPPLYTEPRSANLPLPELDHLMAACAQEAGCFLGVFDAETLTMLALNESARSWLSSGIESRFQTCLLPELIGVRFVDQFHDEMLPTTKRTGRWEGECDLRDAWGSEVPVKLTLVHFPASEQRGAYIGFAAVRTAASPTSQIYDRELLQALLDTVPDAIYFKDAQSRFLRVSRAQAERFGFADGRDMIGKTDFDGFTPEHAGPAYIDERRIIETGEPVLDREEKETWPNGRVTWVSTSKFPLRDGEGRVVGTFGISRDITGRILAERARREMEAKLQLAQKLESIGRLAAGIAHEINTPTQYVSDNVHFVAQAFRQISRLIEDQRALLANDTADLASVRRQLQAAEQELELDYYLKEVPVTIEQTAEGLGRISRIVRSLKEFSHPKNAHRGSADLNRSIETAIAVSRHEWKYVADVVTELDPSLPPVPCVLDQFNQVMLNLIINAAHAIESVLAKRGETRGTITIRTLHTAEHAIIEVQDTGCGIAEQHRSHVFEPFFTTKEAGRGTGQGLAIVHAVVKQHDGSVDFTTQEGVGTTFRILLPLRTPNPDVQPPPTPVR